MEHWELEARESIRDLVARYNATGDSGRFDEMLALFAEDAVMETPAETREGRAQIRAMFEGIASAPQEGPRARFIRHFTATHQIDLVDREHAKGRAYYLVLTDQGLDHWGRYVDEYRRVDGRWLFARRRATLDAALPGGWGDRPDGRGE